MPSDCPTFDARRVTESVRTHGLDDRIIRQALRAKIEREQRDKTAVVLEELGLNGGRVRVDLAVVNGQLHAYEIKSDRDTLRRLHGQVALYSQVADKATLIVGQRFSHAALEFLPVWWGIKCAQYDNGRVQFETIRRPQRNPARDPHMLVQLLWLDQALELLESREAARGVRGRARRFVWDRVCERFDTDEIAAAVRTALKARAVSGGSPSPWRCGELSRSAAMPRLNQGRQPRQQHRG